MENNSCNLNIALKAYILSKLQNSFQTQKSNINSKYLTIGLELEFFLMGFKGKPAEHEESQAFLLELSKQSGWHIQEFASYKDEKILWRVSKDCVDGRYLAVKYDHHPHLMEVAFPYSYNLFDLVELIYFTFDLFEKIAFQLQMTIELIPILNTEASHSSVTSDVQCFKDLRYYRGKLFEYRNEKVNIEAINYAAVIAAAQVHVGGIDWWNNQSFISELHAFEPELLDIAIPKNNKSNVLLKRRWSGYSEVFQGYPLVGFPNISNWTLDNWVQALLESPLAGGEKDYWSGLTAIKLQEKNANMLSLDKFFVAVRDLQIIRPRLFGSIEFRADPSQSISGVTNMMAIRLGICNYLIQNKLQFNFEFQEAFSMWWRSVNSINDRPNVSLNKAIDMSKEGLKLRGLNEESFIKS